MAGATHVLFATHAPRIHADAFRDVEPWSVLTNGLAAAGEYLRQFEFDAIVASSVHWVSTFPFYAGAAEAYEATTTAPEAAELVTDVSYRFAGNPKLAKSIVAHAEDRGLMAFSIESAAMPLDYGTYLPLRHLYPPDGASSPPLVPTSVCLRSEKEDWMAWGSAIARAAQQQDQTIAVLVSGSFSHQLKRGAPEAGPLPEHRAIDDRLVEALMAADFAAFEKELDSAVTEVEIEMGGRHLYTALGVLREADNWESHFFAYGIASGSGNPIIALERP